MYEKGQQVVIRSETRGDEVVIVEEVLVDNGGQKLRVKNQGNGVSRVVDPYEDTIVEHLED